MDFPAYPKTPRFNMGCLVTEKIDGTNAVIVISESESLAPVTDQTDLYDIRAGSRKRWITPEKDNFGFAQFVSDNDRWLIENLGPGIHYGEWYGSGIQRGYGLRGKRFALFDGPGRYPWAVDEQMTSCNLSGNVVTRYVELEGGLIGVVPLVYQGNLENVLRQCLDPIEARALFLPGGSQAQPGFERTEGVIVQLRGSGGGQRFKIVWDKG